MTEHPGRVLEGKVCLVTGAASGIGRAVATRFVRSGAVVFFADRDGEGASTAARATRSTGASPVVLDIADEQSVEAAFAEVLAVAGPPDVVVANAGIQDFRADGPIGELTLGSWRRTIDINLTGTFLTLKHAVRTVRRPGSSVIVTGSPTAINGEGAGFTAYATSKAGIHGMVRVAAADYAGTGIRFNTVVPGFTMTPLVADIANDTSKRAAAVSRVPLGRAGRPEDVVGIMEYLASDESSYATGSLFVVDGGMTSL
ncbi:SDR family oxidoreductase [Georgenia yuyongxinii]|uniref:SDR family oxidoreductase n=1 Tax=Georgenia yuyongxinii TaxID=2589797 RepID=A0A5B8BZY0_9MICO|nr:SDR family oxidoreductase [Georgenia yuyongxinii]